MRRAAEVEDLTFEADATRAASNDDAQRQSGDALRHLSAETALGAVERAVAMALAAVVAVPSAATAAASAIIEPLDAAADVNDGAASRAHVAVQRLAAAVGALVDAVQRGEANAAAAAEVASMSEGTANCRHKWLQLVQRHADGMLHCDELVSRCLAEDAVWIAARTHEVLKELISHHEWRRTGGLAAAIAWASIYTM